MRLPDALLPALPSPPPSSSVDLPAEPAFVSLAVDPELEEGLADTPCGPDVAEAATGIVPLGILTVEIGPEDRVPGDVAVERAAALMCALQGLS